MTDSQWTARVPRGELALLGLLLAAIAAVYWPGLSGGFMFDDEPNFVENPYVAVADFHWNDLWRAAQSGNAGPLGRPVAMLTFALDHLLAGGFEPFAFKLTNLFIHLLTVVSVWLLWRVLPTTPWLPRWKGLPLVAAAVWGLHPINVTSVLYVVQRMTSLAALFSVWAMIAFVLMRSASAAGRPFRLAGSGFALVVFAGMAALSKESALLLPAYLFLIEAVYFRFRNADGGWSRFGIAFQGLAVVIPGLAAMAYVIHGLDGILSGYAIRNFTVEERLLTQARVLWLYVSLVVLPQTGRFGIYHDDFPISTGLFTPVATAWALGAWLIVLAGAVWAVKRAPLLAFGIGWFLVGHVMESTFWPLEMIHEHRNYLPSMGLVYGLVGMLCHEGVLPLSLRLRRMLAGVLAVAVAGVTLVRAQQWSEPVLHATIEASHHPDSDRAQFELGRLYLSLFVKERSPELYRKARDQFERSAALGQGVGGLFGRIHLDAAAGKVADPAVLADLKRRLAIGPPSPANVAFLESLSRCQRLEGCKLTDDQFDAIADALLANPRLLSVHRALVHRTKGRYFFSKSGDMKRARHDFERAVEIDPRSAENWFVLAQFSLIDGDTAAARKAIATTRRLDRRGQYAAELAEMEHHASGASGVVTAE